MGVCTKNGIIDKSVTWSEDQTVAYATSQYNLNLPCLRPMGPSKDGSWDLLSPVGTTSSVVHGSCRKKHQFLVAWGISQAVSTRIVSRPQEGTAALGAFIVSAPNGHLEVVSFPFFFFRPSSGCSACVPNSRAGGRGSGKGTK